MGLYPQEEIDKASAQSEQELRERAKTAAAYSKSFGNLIAE